MTANQGEDGIVGLCELLLARGVGIEAGLLSLADTHVFVRSRLPARCTLLPPTARTGYGSRMPSIFSRIVAREIPAHILREDDDFLAFLDVRPIREGHSLVIPKDEVPDVFELSEPVLSGLLPFARPVARAIQQVTGAQRVGMAVIGLEVPHAHIHLVPIDGLYDLDFRRAAPAEDDELSATAERIRAALAT